MQPDPAITQAVAALITVGQSRGARQATEAIAKAVTEAHKETEAELMKAITESKLDTNAKNETLQLFQMAFEKLNALPTSYEKQLIDNRRQHDALEAGAQQCLGVLHAMAQPKGLVERVVVKAKRAAQVALRELRA